LKENTLNAGIYSNAICSGMEVTMTLTVTREAQTSTNFVGRLLAVLGDSNLRPVALFSTLGVLATIYFAIHSPAAASLFVNFPD
jgi:hypothetical protein